MADNQYLYAVARIHSKELTLLDKQFFEQLLACKNYAECLRLLKDKGWGKSGEENMDQILSMEREKTWELMNELIEDLSIFNLFLYEADFHNLKAAIKQVYINHDVPDIYILQGTIKLNVIIDAVKEHNFAELPEYMRECAEEAYLVQMHSGDSQLCDVIIDKAALDTIYCKGKMSSNDILARYSELKVASSNIKIASRGNKTGKKVEFLKRAFAECDSLDIKELMNATLNDMDAIYNYLSSTVYADAVQAIKESPSSFERWCDNRIIKYIQPQKYNSFTLSPLAAYVLARMIEIKSVRILLSGKLNHLPETSIRERLRETYV